MTAQTILSVKSFVRTDLLKIIIFIILNYVYVRGYIHIHIITSTHGGHKVCNLLGLGL